jgi:hypothetical protein
MFRREPLRPGESHRAGAVGRKPDFARPTSRPDFPSATKHIPGPRQSAAAAGLGAPRIEFTPSDYSAPVLSRSVRVLPRRGYIDGQSVDSAGVRTALRWHVHGAAQNRRDTVSTVSRAMGAPSFSPYRSGVIQDRSLMLTRMRGLGKR